VGSRADVRAHVDARSSGLNEMHFEGRTDLVSGHGEPGRVAEMWKNTVVVARDGVGGVRPLLFPAEDDEAESVSNGLLHGIRLSKRRTRPNFGQDMEVG